MNYGLDLTEEHKRIMLENHMKIENWILYKETSKELIFLTRRGSRRTIKKQKSS